MPIELEKKSLEMHVELDAMRQKSTDEALEEITKKIDELFELHKELKQMVDDMKDERNDQLIKWGTAIIVGLFSALSALLLKIIIPVIMKAGH